MTSPLDRAKQLVAKAVDPACSEEEARTVALIAVKLIAQHKMLDELEEVEEPPVSPPHHRPPHQAVDPLEAFWEIFVRAAGMDGAPFPRRPRPPAGRSPSDPPPHAARPPPGPARPPPGAASPFRPVGPTYPGRRDSDPWWERLPCELWLFGNRHCEVCGKMCESGELVWAYEMAPPDFDGPRPRVVHLHKCREKLPPHQRYPKRRSA
jgi:hypothetical protein